MNGYAASAKLAYTEAAVMTATPERLVVMLYEGALRFLQRAAAAMRAGQDDAARVNVHRANAILDELNVSLDMRYGEIPERLRSIYLFSKRQLIDAGQTGDVDTVDTIARLLGELHEAFAQAADGSPTAAP
jgi:flagellar protein FliS